MADMPAYTLIGKFAGDGTPDYLIPSVVRSLLNVADGANAYVHPNHSGDVTSVADGAQTISNNVVNNAKLAQVAVNIIKGRKTAGTGNVEDLTVSDVLAMLDVYTQTETDNLLTNKAPLSSPALTGTPTAPTATTGTDTTQIASTEFVQQELDVHKADDTNAHNINTKAGKTQEEWQTATLLNGWTSVGGESVQYMKDEFGFLHFRGRCSGGAISDETTVMTLPIGYIVTSTYGVSTSTSNGTEKRLTDFAFGIDGTVRIYSAYANYLNFNIPPIKI